MWTDTSPAINPHVVEPPLGTSPWPESLARWNTKIFTTGNPNHNVSLSFQFSCLGQKAPVVRFQLFRKLFKENRTKNHNAFKNTQRAGGEALFSIFELTRRAGRGSTLREMLVPGFSCHVAHVLLSQGPTAAVSQRGVAVPAPRLFTPFLCRAVQSKGT